MTFDRWTTRYLLPALLLALVVAAYLEFSTDTTVQFVTDGGVPLEIEREASERSWPQAEQDSRDTRLIVGEQYRSLAELVTRQQVNGYVRVGLFGNHWPARVVEIVSDRDGIRFMHSNGTPHTYSKFDGYDMQMVRLKQGSKETMVVFRSQLKR